MLPPLKHRIIQTSSRLKRKYDFINNSHCEPPGGLALSDPQQLSVSKNRWRLSFIENHRPGLEATGLHYFREKASCDSQVNGRNLKVTGYMVIGLNRCLAIMPSFCSDHQRLAGWQPKTEECWQSLDSYSCFVPLNAMYGHDEDNLRVIGTHGSVRHAQYHSKCLFSHLNVTPTKS